MDNFCDFITNPDWWSVIATILAAITVAVITYVLGKRQNELQQQQLKLQEQQIKLQEQQNYIQGYEMHKMMFHFIYRTNSFAAILLPRIYDYLQACLSKNNSDNNSLLGIKREIATLAEDYDNKFVDINIQLSTIEAFDCNDLIYSMEKVVEKLEYIIDDNGLKENYMAKERILSTDDSVYVDAILEFIKEDFGDEYNAVLVEFCEMKDYVSGLFNSMISSRVNNISF